MNPITKQLMMMVINDLTSSLKQNEFVAFDGVNFGKLYIHPNQQEAPYLTRRQLVNENKTNLKEVMEGPWVRFYKLTIEISIDRKVNFYLQMGGK